MDVGKAGGVGDDGVGDEGAARGAAGGTVEGGLVAGAVAGLDAGAPSAQQHVPHVLAAAGDVAGAQAVDAGNEAGVLDHEGHELAGIAAEGKEFEAVVLDERLEGGVGGDAHAVAVALAQHLAEGDEGLHVAAGADDLDQDVERRGVGGELGREVGGRLTGEIALGRDGGPLLAQSRR